MITCHGDQSYKNDVNNNCHQRKYTPFGGNFKYTILFDAYALKHILEQYIFLFCFIPILNYIALKRTFKSQCFCSRFIPILNYIALKLMIQKRNVINSFIPILNYIALKQYPSFYKI